MTALEMTEGPLPLLLVIAACHCCLSLLSAWWCGSSCKGASDAPHPLTTAPDREVPGASWGWARQGG